ncbi:hypothetical protein PIROE2DRAFT_17128, partial [Piromyces sp. E2]
MKIFNFGSLLFMSVTLFSTAFSYWKGDGDNFMTSFDDTLIYTEHCLQDNKKVCSTYTSVLRKVIEQVNVDE